MPKLVYRRFEKIGKSRKPWIAQIQGRCSKYRFKRSFLPFLTCHREAVGTENRGVFYEFYFNPKPDEVYEMEFWIGSNDSFLRGEHFRYFCRFEDGEEVRLKESEIAEYA